MYKRRKLSATLPRRMAEDHSRGFYLTQCRDLIEERTPGQAWVVQSSDGYSGQQYTVTALVGSCAMSCCAQCTKCPHQYACTCPRYYQEDAMSCKHTHAINQIVLLKQLDSMKKEEDDEEEEDEDEDEEEEEEEDGYDDTDTEAKEDPQVPEAEVEVEVVETSDGDYYPDFSEPVGFRRFQLRVKGPKSIFSLFINAHMLAELSPRFADLCFDEGFLEKKQAMVDDESYKDLLELMRCVFHCSSSSFLCKPVSIYNVALLVRLAHKYQIAQLKSHCDKFLTTAFRCHQVGPDFVFKILMIVANAEYSREAVAAVIGRAATYDMQTLNQAKLAEKLPPNVWSALLEAKKRYRPSRSCVTIKRKGHRFAVDYDGTPIVSKEEYCWEHGTMCERSNCRNCAGEYCRQTFDENDDCYDEDAYMEECSKRGYIPVVAARVNIALLG